ncbi:MAG: hypothetical protein NG712_02840 [Omnitrophica bacterium]|nr:hypothetical protein [Candidatus Omnitrophota bacterium]
MSTFSSLSQEAFSKKILLAELDIGQTQTFFTNWAAGIWYVDFDAVYSRAEPWMTDNISSQRINAVGSVYANGTLLLKVNSLADVHTNDKSFYWDSGDKVVYLKLPNSDSPELFNIVFGVAIKVSNKAGVYGGDYYDGRLVSVPNINKSKDPMFFGKISFDGGKVVLLNEDGEFDLYGEEQDIFGNPLRLYLGFGDLEFSSFKELYEGFIEECKIGEGGFEIEVSDKRKQLNRKLPIDTYYKTEAPSGQTNYPDLKDKNIGKSIPVGWGVIKNAEVVCTNEEVDPAGVPWEFKICNCTYHAINAITQVYVEGFDLVGVSTDDLANGEFTLAYNATPGDGEYKKGDKVTVDYSGYEDEGGTLISNGMDQIKDILLSYYYPIAYNNYYFNVDEWNHFTLAAADVSIFIAKLTETWKIIEDISYATAGNWLVQDNGLYTFRIYDSARSTVQTIYYYELMDSLELAVIYDPQEVLTSCRIGYNKDWNEDEYIYKVNSESEEQNYLKYKTYRDKTFDTLLTSEAAAYDFSVKIMELSGIVNKPIEVRTKMQSVDRVIGDMIKVQYRTKNRTFLGWLKCEVIGKMIDLNKMEVNLTCRIVKRTEADPSRALSHIGDQYNTRTYNGATAHSGELYSKTLYRDI